MLLVLLLYPTCHFRIDASSITYLFFSFSCFGRFLWCYFRFG